MESEKSKLKIVARKSPSDDRRLPNDDVKLAIDVVKLAVDREKPEIDAVLAGFSRARP